MKDKSLIKEIDRLEFINDQLEAEIQYVDKLLRMVGFPDGLTSVKKVAQEVIETEQHNKEVDS